MTALNCLVHNANTYVIHGNSLSLETWGGFHVRRSPFGGELFRLTREHTDDLIRMPLSKPATTSSTAFTAPTGTIQEAAPEVKAALDEVSASFPVNKKGQVDFGF